MDIFTTFTKPTLESDLGGAGPQIDCASVVFSGSCKAVCSASSSVSLVALFLAN